MKKTIAVCLGVLIYVSISQGRLGYATETFDNVNGIQFENDTTAKFSLLTTNGKLMSYFGVVPEADYLDLSERTYLFNENFPGYDLPKTGDWLGTCAPGKTLTPPCDTFFTFEGGIKYTLFIENDLNRNGIFEPALFESVVFSTDALNVGAAFQMQLLTGGSWFVNAEDRLVALGGADNDFNDFQVHVETVIPEFPEQAIIPLFALLSFIVFRVRNKSFPHLRISV